MTIQGTAWSTSDFASGGGYNTPILSNANLTCQLTSANNNSTVCVGVEGQAGGKFYVEFLPVAGASRGLGVGVIKQTQSRLVGSGSLNSTGCALALGPGFQAGININNAIVGSFGTMANGTVVGMAIDITGKLIWFRNGAAGNWNNSGPANPATGVGGLSIAALTGNLKLMAWECAFSTPNVTVTLNAGSSGFTGAVPSGFTAGWPSSNPLNPMAFNTQF